MNNVTMENYKGNIIGYKLICETIGCNIKKNKNDRDKQIKDWEDFMDFERIGVKFKILDVFDTPSIIDGRVEKSKFSKHLKSIILSYDEVQDKKYELYTKVYKIFNDVPLPQNCSQELRIYKSEFDTKISKIFNAAIKSLQKEKAIKYLECYFIKEEEKGKVRQAKQYEVEMINAFNTKWKESSNDNRKVLSLAIKDFNEQQGFYQTWREHYIKVYSPKMIDSQQEVIELRGEIAKYMSKRLKTLGIKETDEITKYKKSQLGVL